ncbi:LuxR family two component transcriptional regulator [Arcticibacter pallidicorallinus]|uniref:LuxR family two component transcriptional regulator n=1 Tax=Arcticibacter pallidicorallinus TaxID=1259464 RepID=A0A2T0TXE3_9SPHI|nr:response regulator transcription factor [Arcticibacter pallidicorallinus]PRY50303.1 LuxR family two component transcriptional regulator [Arcticibacter pallidicorallinus]
MKSIKVFLVEDHNIVRNGIRTLLERQTDIEIAGEAETVNAALEKLRTGIQVNIILSDINMPDRSGLDLIDIVTSEFPNIKVIMLTMLDHENYIKQSIRAGASGYLLKNIDIEQMLFAIRHIALGGRYISSEIVFEMFKKQLSSPPELGAGELVELSQREEEVLHLIADGFTNQEIADKLFTSRRTVEGHRQNLLEKTRTKNTATLIRYAIRNSIIN